jgi:Ca-activated chloride channel family protein
MAELHFENPLWLLALIPLALLLWALANRPAGGNSWRNVIDKKLQPLLLGEQSTEQKHRWLWLLTIGWLIGVIALANPAWQRKPQPVFQTSTARVIVLDLSTSMAISDLRPSRLARAKFKIRDLLDLNQEGQTGLVVFAGDAFTVTPLTRDNDTIKALLDALDPAIMPVQGSRADLGLLQAGDLLAQSGSSHGQVILIADGAERSAAIAALASSTPSSAFLRSSRMASPSRVPRAASSSARVPCASLKTGCGGCHML